MRNYSCAFDERMNDKYKDTMRDLAYLSKSDTIRRLDDTNYHLWRPQVRAFLMDKKLWSCINPGQTKPVLGQGVTQANIDAWQERQDSCYSKIFLTINEGDAANLEHIEGPKNLWDELERMFAPKNSLWRSVILRRKLSNLKLSDFTSMYRYIGACQAVKNELTACGDPIQDLDVTLAIIQGLGPEWDVLAQSICAMDRANVTCAIVKEKLMAEAERRASVTTSSTFSTTAGTSEAAAYKAEVNQQQFTSKVTSGVRCYTCSGYGHVSRECPTKKPSNSANKVAQERGRGRGRYDRGRGRGRGGFVTGQVKSVEDQEKELCLIIKTEANNIESVDKNQWILDSGAGLHISNNLKYFVYLKEGDYGTVTTANGQSNEIKGIGTIHGVVKVGNTRVPIRMIDVVYVPNLTHNFMSTLQLTRNGKNVTQRKDDYCDVVKRSTGQKLWSIKAKKNLCRFTVDPPKETEKAESKKTVEKDNPVVTEAGTVGKFSKYGKYKGKTYIQKQPMLLA